MNKFLKHTTYHEETGNTNRLIVSYESESVTKNLPACKSPGLDSCTSEVYQTFKELIPVLLKLFQKTEKEGILPNYFTKSALP